MANYWSRLHLERVEKVSQLSITIRRWKPDLLIIDHLQLLAGAEKVETLSVNTRQLKLMAERFSTPILCLSQLSRAETQERGKLPRLSRLRGSGTIEQDADTVVFVWRKRDENEALTDEAALVVAKSRMGTLGAVRATFDGERQSFAPLTNEYSQEF
jgi:replicative DNA helicase